ncbi:MAG: hypothetical protein LBR48_07950, partial [Dysgonamonadaceae bacterium]|nr:hypothetical protein [Dysgonamonadaceae bacterium]
MNVLILNNRYMYSVAPHINFDWEYRNPKLRHPELHSVCRWLFKRSLFCSKYLIEIIWNIPLKAIVNSDLIICFEWTAAQNPLMLAWLRCCFPNKRLIIWIWNLHSPKLYTHLKNFGWEIWNWDKRQCEKLELNYSKTFMVCRYVPFEHHRHCVPCYDTGSHLQSPVVSGNTVFFFGDDKGRLPAILEIKKILDNCGIANDINVVGQYKSTDDYKYVKPLPYPEILEKLQNCQAILDIPLSGQHGITQREMEALFFHKKLITTNAAVKERDYYHPDNIFVIDLTRHSRESGNLLPTIAEFLQKPYVEIDREIIESYSIEAWLQRFRNNESAKNYSEFQRKNFFEALKRRIVRNSIFQKNGISSAKIKIPKNKTDFGRIAVYMVNTGGYDTVLDPLVV